MIKVKCGFDGRTFFLSSAINIKNSVFADVSDIIMRNQGEGFMQSICVFGGNSSPYFPKPVFSSLDFDPFYNEYANKVTKGSNENFLPKREVRYGINEDHIIISVID